MLTRLIKAIRRRLTPVTPEERRHAHNMILLSCAGGTPMAGKDGKIQVGHIKAKPDEK